MRFSFVAGRECQLDEDESSSANPSQIAHNPAGESSVVQAPGSNLATRRNHRARASLTPDQRMPGEKSLRSSNPHRRTPKEPLDNRSRVGAAPCTNWDLRALTGADEGFSRASLTSSRTRCSFAAPYQRGRRFISLSVDPWLAAPFHWWHCRSKHPALLTPGELRRGNGSAGKGAAAIQKSCDERPPGAGRPG